MITHRPGHLAPPADPADPAVPPLDDDLEEMFAELVGGGAGLDMVLDGLRHIALERHDIEDTKTNLLCLAGAEPNVVDLIRLVVARRLGDPAANPALRDLTAAQQAEVRALTTDYARLGDEAQLSALICETAAVIDGI